MAVLCKIGITQKIIQSTEHASVFHMVSVQHTVIIREVLTIPAVEEDTPRQRIVTIWIYIKVLGIIVSLHNRVVDIGIIDGDPGHHVFCNGSILRNALFCRRLILQVAVIICVMIDIPCVVQTIRYDQQGKHKYKKHELLIQDVHFDPKALPHRLSIPVTLLHIFFWNVLSGSVQRRSPLPRRRVP